jgi:hypothetical protein
MRKTQSLNLDAFGCFSVRRRQERRGQPVPLAEPEVKKEEAPNEVRTRVLVYTRVMTDVMQDARPVPAPNSSGVAGKVVRSASVRLQWL